MDMKLLRKMRNSRFFALAIVLFLMQTETNSVFAQCSNINLSATSTPASCYNNGAITVTIGGTDLSSLRLSDAQLSLTAIGGGQSIGFTVWSPLLMVAPDSSVKIYTQAIKGDYTVSLKAFCKSINDWYTVNATTTVSVEGTYEPLVVNISTARKSMSCKPTGDVRISFASGKPPFLVTISAPSGYTPPAPFYINPKSDTIILLGNACPAGTYSVTVVDSCGYTVSPTHNSPALANDIPTTLYLYMERQITSTNCKTMVPYSTYTVTDPDEQYYWTNSGTYYEYCYLLNNTGVKNWQALTNKMPPFTLPNNYSSYCSPVDNALWSYLRPTGCTTERSLNHDFNTYICLSGSGINVNIYEGNTCNTARISSSLSYYYAYCYPVQWKITPYNDTTVAIQSGTLNNYGDLITYNGTSADYPRGNTYTVIITDADGVRRTANFLVPAASGQSFSSSSGISTGTATCYWRYASIYTTGAIAAGTKIKYVSGPMPVLPCGLSIGATDTIPVGWTSSNYYYTSTTKANTTGIQQMLHGVYIFEITNSCGVVTTSTHNMVSYTTDPLTYTTQQTCGEGFKVFPSGRIKQISQSGTLANLTTYYYIVSGPQGVSFSTARIDATTAGAFLTLPAPGTYTIGMSSTTNGCPMTTTTVEFPAQGLYLDPDLTAAYSCDSNSSCLVRVKATFGVQPYTYTISTDASSSYTPIITPQTNNTGFFPAIGVVGGKYIINVKDACNTSFDLPVTILDLANAHILYTSNSVATYCHGSEIEINCVALGATSYEWRNPQGVVFSTEQRPRPIANYPSSSGKYTVRVTPEGCQTPIIDTIEVGVLEGAPNWTVPNPIIVLCQNTGNVNIVDSAGVVAAAGCTLKWYANATDTTPIMPPVSFSTATLLSTVFYVSQLLTSTGCESERKPISVSVNTSLACICSNPATVNFSPIPTVVCDTTPINSTVTLGGSAITFTVAKSANAGGTLSPSTLSITGTSLTYTPVVSDIGKTITITATTNNPGAPCTATTNTLSFTITLPSTPNNFNINPQQTVCYGKTLNDIPVSGITVNWYAASTGGSPLPMTSLLNTGIYYAAAVSGGCESINRFPVSVTVNPLVVPTLEIIVSPN